MLFQPVLQHVREEDTSGQRMLGIRMLCRLTCQECFENMTEDKSLVTFILSGKYEWYDQNREHVRIGLYDNRALTVCAPLPSDDIRLRSNEKKGFLTWLSKTLGRWVVKNHANPCHGCEDPWCLFKNNTDILKKIIKEAKSIPNHVLNNKKRHHYYR